MNECPTCGLPGIEMTVHGDAVQSFACTAGHRWQLVPDMDGAPHLHQQPDRKTGFKGFLQRLFS